MTLDIALASYTQICRRSAEIDVTLTVPKSSGPIYIVVDSTGLKIYGEGEWKTSKHGTTQHRRWRKLHLGIDEKTGYIHAQILTGNSHGDGDAQQVEELLEQVQTDIDKFSGDGAYDTRRIWKLLKDKEIQGIIPPQHNAKYWVNQEGELLDLDRNGILKDIIENGRKEWKKKSGYHRRSLSETAMFRFKTIFGPTLYSKKFNKQKTEAAIKVKCLNIMTGTGMPVSEKIVA